MRHYFAAVAGLFAAAGIASAQAPAPKFTPAGNYADAPVQPNAGFTPAGNLTPGSILQASGCSAPVVASGPGCSACQGPRTRNCILGRAFNGPGTAMPIQCSCLAAERTFLFGSCSQFFNPTNYCGGVNSYGGGCNFGGAGGRGGCAGGGCGGGAGGGGVERHPCQGVTSYLNR